jgi:hypothetical protein
VDLGAGLGNARVTLLSHSGRIVFPRTGQTTGLPVGYGVAPFVLGVCRRILRNEQDAEDAFQVTFLLLVSRATSLQCPSTIANWLYGVAYRHRESSTLSLGFSLLAGWLASRGVAYHQGHGSPGDGDVPAVL